MSFIHPHSIYVSHRSGLSGDRINYDRQRTGAVTDNRSKHDLAACSPFSITRRRCVQTCLSYTMNFEDSKRSAKRKHVTLSIVNKLKVIELLEKGVSGRKIADDFGISQQTVSDIKKRKESFKAYALKFDPANEDGLCQRQTMKKPRDTILDETVFRWYTKQKSSGCVVKGIELQAAADKLAKELDISDFSSSSGWLWRFRRRHNIVSDKSGEKTTSSQQMADEINSDASNNSKLEQLPNRFDEERIEFAEVKQEAYSNVRQGVESLIDYVKNSTNTDLKEYYQTLKSLKKILKREERERTKNSYEECISAISLKQENDVVEFYPTQNEIMEVVEAGSEVSSRMSLEKREKRRHIQRIEDVEDANTSKNVSNGYGSSECDFLTMQDKYDFFVQFVSRSICDMDDNLKDKFVFRVHKLLYEIKNE